MSSIEITLKKLTAEAVQSLYGETVAAESVTLNTVPAEMAGHFAIVVFPFVRLAKKKPEEVGAEIGAYLKANCNDIAEVSVEKGFCNLTIKDSYWHSFTNAILAEGDNFGKLAPKNKKVIIEYSSPNTNKPLHLGHVRNNLLGYATCQILEQAGYEVIKTQVINDRGIHICKSMLAWQQFLNDETPESIGMKPDHFVGKCYVRFEQEFQLEYKAWQQTDAAQTALNTWLANEAAVLKVKKDLIKDLEKEAKGEDGVVSDEKIDQALRSYFFKEVHKNTYFNKQSPLGQAATTMLEQWEAGDAEVRALWEKMNNWVYEGMNQTYARLGVAFDKNYYESQTYLLGKDIIERGLNSGTFFKHEDNSVRVDLRDAKLDEKVLLRSNGTSVYITQDIGMAPLRHREYGMDKMIYVVGDEQEYHFKVLFEILKRLDEPYASGLYHLSYGMVELTTGRMKSREGTVVDADDLMDEVINEVAAESAERNTLDGLADTEKQDIYRRVGLGALKFYILKVNPKSRMIFDPKQSIDLQGQTGPYIQNAYVRTQAVQRRAAELTLGNAADYTTLEKAELHLLRIMHEYPNVVNKAAEAYNPADVANFIYELARGYHHFWGEINILRSAPDAAAFRIELSKAVALVLRSAARLLGMEMPERM